MARTNRDWKIVSARDIMASRGRFIMRVNHGAFHAQKWPRKRGRPTSRRQLAWVNHFSCLNSLSKMPDPYTHLTAQSLAHGNGWYPRDMVIAAANGNLYGVEGEIKVTTPTARIHQAATHVLTSAVELRLTGDVLDWDNANFWSSTSNPARLTFTNPGLYLVMARVLFNAVTGSFRDVKIRLNGVTDLSTPRSWPATGNSDVVEAHDLWYFHAGDYIECFAQANTSGITARLMMLAVVGIVPEAA